MNGEDWRQNEVQDATIRVLGHVPRCNVIFYVVTPSDIRNVRFRADRIKVRNVSYKGRLKAA